jgi:hypothetical protein
MKKVILSFTGFWETSAQYRFPKSQFKQRGPMVSGDDLNWDCGGGAKTII